MQTHERRIDLWGFGLEPEGSDLLRSVLMIIVKDFLVFICSCHISAFEIPIGKGVLNRRWLCPVYRYNRHQTNKQLHCERSGHWFIPDKGKYMYHFLCLEEHILLTFTKNISRCFQMLLVRWTIKYAPVISPFLSLDMLQYDGGIHCDVTFKDDDVMTILTEKGKRARTETRITQCASFESFWMG